MYAMIITFINDGRKWQNYILIREVLNFVYFYFFVVKIFYVRGLVSTGAVGASAPMIFQVVGASKNNFCGF